jgi:phosphatidylserine decarboxylase
MSVKHKGKAKAAFHRIMLWALGIYWILGLLLIMVSRFFILGILAAGVITLTGLLIGFALFAGYFFRDPEAQVPVGSGLIVAPGHGTVDVIDETEESSVLGGRCRRVSIFLSVFNVHVQQAPVAGTVIRVRHTPGQFLNAMKLESAALNENVLIGFQTSEPACGPVAMLPACAERVLPRGHADGHGRHGHALRRHGQSVHALGRLARACVEAPVSDADVGLVAARGLGAVRGDRHVQRAGH